MKRPYDVAVICYNEKFTIRRCLTTVQAFTDYERLIIVDDESTDGTTEVAEMFADVLVSSGAHNLGISRQLALEASDQPVLLFVDADVEIVRRVDPVIEKVTRAYPCVRGKNWQLMANRFTKAHEWGVGFGLTAIDTKIARSVGGFPPAEAGEDSAFCLRLKDGGFRCRQVGDKVYGIHYKSDYATMPSRKDWPCENFDEIVEAIADGDPGLISAAIGAVDPHRLQVVISQAVCYGVMHQLRRRRSIIID